MPTTLNYDNLHTELNSLMDSLTCDSVKAHEDYEQLYHAIANGQERPDNATICNILKNAEKTPDDLKNDVEWRIRRSKMIEEYQSIPALQEEKEQEEAALAKLYREWKAVEAKYQADCWPHECRVDQIRRRLNELWRHEQLLKDDCRCEALIVGRSNVQYQRGKICDERKVLEIKIDGLRYKAREAQFIVDEKAIYPGYETIKENAKITVNECEREIAKLQKQIAKLDLKIAEHDAEITRIEEQMICD